MYWKIYYKMQTAFDNQSNKFYAGDSVVRVVNNG